ncbi:MAG TPA: TraB/GumN family protein, partial [Wenzhouxiangella sp.]|nr:TraB/GumN family protein [Wenzhouxiangella sp.]
NRQLEKLPAHIANYFNEQGLEERNRRMLERARPWLEQGGLIIAVGALHLPGKDGLLALLANEGWQLQGIY